MRAYPYLKPHISFYSNSYLAQLVFKICSEKEMRTDGHGPDGQPDIQGDAKTSRVDVLCLLGVLAHNIGEVTKADLGSVSNALEP